MIPCLPNQITKERVDKWYMEWELLRNHIHAAHDERNGQAKQLMEQGIQLFWNFILESSQTTSTAINRQDEFELMPLNGSERLQFIQLRPAQYACYRQLDELFKETKKRAASLRVKLK